MGKLKYLRRSVLVASVIVVVATPVLGANTIHTGPPWYAVSIHEWVAGEGALPGSPADPIGPPHHDVLTDAWGIGRGGTLTLDMGVGFFDAPGADLKVYEYGSTWGGTSDPYEVWVSADASTFHFVGWTPGDVTTFELGGIGSAGPFRYVKIVDADTGGLYDGADIDAVEVFVPEPATLLVLGLGGVGLIRRRRATGRGRS